MLLKTISCVEQRTTQAGEDAAPQRSSSLSMFSGSGSGRDSSNQSATLSRDLSFSFSDLASVFTSGGSKEDAMEEGESEMEFEGVLRGRVLRGTACEVCRCVVVGSLLSLWCGHCSLSCGRCVVIMANDR